MRKALTERGLRLGDLVKREWVKILKKGKKLRRAAYLSVCLPALFNQSRNEEWARRLKEKINDWYL